MNSMRNDIWKWFALLVIAVFSIYVTFPVAEKLRFGLDLKGGTSFTLGVDEEKLADNILAADPSLAEDEAKLKQKKDEVLKGCDSRIVQVVRRRVDGMGMNEPVIQSIPEKHRLLVQLPGIDSKTSAAAKKSLQSAAFLEFRLVSDKSEKLLAEALKKKNYPDPVGYERDGDLFKRVAGDKLAASNAGSLSSWGLTGKNRREFQFVLELVHEKVEGGGSEPRYRGHYVERHPGTASRKPITGAYLKHASVGRDQGNRLTIDFTFNDAGAKLFSEVTRKNRQRQLAIILDGLLVSAPVIQSEIGRNGQITGNFTADEAQQLANVLNAGALPAPLKILAESTVSPTVGEDAKQAGLVAACLGFALVAFFMLVYYWYAGLVANVALLLDVVLLPAALVFVANVLGVFANDAAMGATGSLALPVLTMPGIAGLVLTLGMAVDANVIIFERIREEFQAKASTGTAIKNGYGRAFTAILDSNITTIVTGIILFVVGTGPVRGFAITLTGGVIISMFTAVVVTRLVFDNTTNPDGVKPFKMLNFFKKTPNVNFVGLGRITTVVSFALVVITLAIFFVRAFTKPASVLAVDLTGGTSIMYAVDQKAKPSVADVRKTLDAFDNATIIQYQEGVGDSTLLVKTGYTAESAKDKGVTDVGAHVTKLLQDAFKDANIQQISVEEVGSMVGADLKASGTKAVLFSLVAILIYVAFRFEFGFGLGALVALAHDALISLGLFSLCGRQVSLLVVTALLTIIGYSVNDTIVVFDRIREDLRKDPKTPFKELCNRALNQCLSRTVITSITTFFAVVALFAFGDGSIFDFALTMLIGVVVGTYSSMFIATPVMMWFYRGRRPQFNKDVEQSK